MDTNDDEGGFDPEALASIEGISVEEARARLAEPAIEFPARGPGLTPPKGHNKPPKGDGQMFSAAAKEKLQQVVQGIVFLEEEVAEAKERVKEAFSEAKSMGYDVPTLRWAIKEAKMDRQAREERDLLRATYAAALEDLEFYAD